MLELLLVLMFSMFVQGQLSVTWNGTTITGPVLIYHDELPVDPNATTIGGSNGPRTLICRSEDSARVSWHYVHGFTVKGFETNDTHVQIRREGVTPSLAQLLLKKVAHETARPDFNGLWHCRLNAMGHIDVTGATYEEQINVGIYFRGKERGRISSNPWLSLQSSSFGSNPPTFTLVGDTSGGPPTNYTWMRDGQVITNGGPYNISIAVNGTSLIDYEQAHYRSKLTVTGILAGVYQYSVTNSATSAIRTSSFNITGGARLPFNVISMQNGQNTVQVNWTGPLAGRYRVTSVPEAVNVDHAISPQTITLQPGVYNISVLMNTSHHYWATTRPVQVTVRGALQPNATILSVTATSVTVSWTQPPFSFTPVDYTVTLRRVTGSGQVLCSTVEDNRPPVTIMPTVTSVQSTGLQEFSVYRVTVTARFSEFGLSLTSSSSMQFTTLSASPTGVPDNVTITTTSGSVNALWNAIQCIEINSFNITGYTVEFQEQDGARILGEVVGQTFTASGLTPHTNYTFRVAGVNNNGTGPYFTTTITTGDDVPGTVSDFMAESTFYFILLTWSPPEEPNGNIIAYEVTYRVNSSELITINTTSTTYILRLTPNTNLSAISVRAYTSVGPGDSSAHPDVSIPDDPTLSLTYATRNLSIAVVLTFLLTIILCAVIWLVWFTIYRTRHSNRNNGGVGIKQGAVYEEVDTNLRRKKDGGEMAMTENEAYGPVTATHH